MALGRKTGGRQKGSLNLSTREMREMAQGMAKDVLDTLKNILDDATQPGEVRIKAGKEILDRGYGKARQSSVQAVGTYDFSALSDEQLRVSYEILKLASPKSLGDMD